MSCPNPSAHPVGVRQQGDRPLVLNGRKRLVTVAARSRHRSPSVGSRSPATPAQAEPDIDDVRARVDRLYHEAEQAQERYNDAKLELDELAERPRLARGRPGPPGRRDRARPRPGPRLGGAPVPGREPRPPSARSSSPTTRSAFLDQLSTMSAFNDLQSQLFDKLRHRGRRRSRSAQDGHRAARRRRRRRPRSASREEKATVDAKLAEAKDLLGELEAEEREAMRSPRSAVRVPSDVPASGGPAAAVAVRLAQVGDAYVYGAAGPERLRLLRA